MALVKSLVMYLQCTIFWGSLILCDYALAQQTKQEVEADERDQDTDSEKEAWRKLAFKERLRFLVFGENTSLNYFGSKYQLYTLSNVVFGVTMWILSLVLGDHDGSLNRNLVNIQLPFHLLVALSSLYLDGFDTTFNPIKSQPEVPLYNILSVLTSILWFVMIIVEPQASFGNDGSSEKTTASEVATLYILDFLVQPFWTGAYIMTSFLPFGVLNAYLSIKFLAFVAVDYASMIKFLGTFQSSMAASIATAMAAAFGLVAIPMAVLFISPRLRECIEQLETVTTEIQEEVRENPYALDDVLEVLSEAFPEDFNKTLQAFPERISAEFQELKKVQLFKRKSD